VELDRKARMMAVVNEAADAAASMTERSEKGRRSTESIERGRAISPGGLSSGGLGTGLGRDKRKRWSVCGAERRGDLDLETIWEDQS
jgi:hypothetical protein